MRTETTNEAETDPIEMDMRMSLGILDPRLLHKAATERWLSQGDTPEDAAEIFGTPEDPNLPRCIMEFVDLSGVQVEVRDWREAPHPSA